MNHSDRKERHLAPGKRRRRWRLIPAITFTDWSREEYYRQEPAARWFRVRRFSDGRVIHLIFGHCDLCFDFSHD